MSKLYIVGIGPGDERNMTLAAKAAIEGADVVVGYSKYIELVKLVFPEKRFFDTPMRKEAERCRAALDMCADGNAVALVCSGDAGVYGMAGLVYELNCDYPGVKIEVVAGVTAALSGGAVLGAPLTHDFCVISLSDLMTPWELIARRLRAAAAGDFAIAIYNPSSMKRSDYLKQACDILLEIKDAETVCGYVRNIGRGGEECAITTLGTLRDVRVDMFTTVFIGNSMTRVINGKMVTPRGYALETVDGCK